MPSRILVTALSLLLPLAIGCGGDAPLSPANHTPSLAPAQNENSKKSVFVFDQTDNVTCPGNGVVLSRNAKGWVQTMTFEQEGNKNVVLQVFHQVLTFTNATTGKTFVFRDVGPDHYYLNDEGNLIIAITGRSTGSGVIGHVVINLDTGETLLVAGKEFGTATALACEALT